jgi:undecaprenyl-phosphate galactose phosphotransferase
MQQPITSVSPEPVLGEQVRIPARQAVFPYKTMLAIHDLVVALAAAAAGIWIAGIDGFQKIYLLGLGLLPIAFFDTFGLYNYHLIFSRRYHLAGLGKAFAFGLLSFTIFCLCQAWPYSASPGLIVSVLAGLCLLGLLCSRFLEDKLALLLKALGLAFVAVGLAGFAGFRGSAISPQQLPEVFIVLLMVLTVLTATRYFTVHSLFNVKLRRRFRRQVLLVGTNEDAERLTNYIISRKAPFWIAGTVCSQPREKFCCLVPKNNLGKIQELETILGEQFFQEAIITDEIISKPELIDLLDFFTSKGINVWFLPKLMPIIELKLKIDHICGIPMVRLNSRQQRWLYDKVKHAFDAIAGLVFMVLALPLLGCIALAVKLSSEGPVFYKTQAIGKGGRLFSLYKFRSMVCGANKDLHKDYVTRLIRGEIAPDGAGTPLKITNDPRVTKVGKILRRSSLDELPQLINVLKGEMSLVGPRPCLPYEYEIYKDWHKKRTNVRPGITGIWQVSARSEVSFEDMILLDLYYIYNHSIELDLGILFETIFVMLNKKGAH